MQAKEIAVVGGGLGGLVAAVLLAKGGHRVTVYERARDFGGRARTTEVDGFRFNLGPHALYRAGAAARVLGRLGVKPEGSVPADGSYALKAGRLHTLPKGPVSLLTTDLLGLAGKLEAARVLARLGRMDTASLARTPLSEWLRTSLARDESRALLAATVRVATYCADTERLSAGAALEQVQLALSGNVLYVDGGWSTLVDALEVRAREAGVRLETSAKVERVEHENGHVTGLRLAPPRAPTVDHDEAELDESARASGGATSTGASGTGPTTRPVDAVVMTGSPADMAALLPGDTVLAGDAERALPVKAATLELGLRKLPRSGATFALGIDGPYYVSVHSAAAKRLAPEGQAMVHGAPYLGGKDTEASEQQLEAAMDALQPGWREHVVARRYRPSLTVTNAIVTADSGGLRGRPTAEVPHLSGLFRVGDWVGPTGMLADATCASAEAVEQALLGVEEPHDTRASPRRAVGA